MKKVLVKNYKEIMLLAALLGVLGCFTYGQIQKNDVVKQAIVRTR